MCCTWSALDLALAFRRRVISRILNLRIMLKRILGVKLGVSVGRLADRGIKEWLQLFE